MKILVNFGNIDRNSAAIKRTAALLAILSFTGFLAAFYLTVEHLTGGPVNCIVVSGCDKVLSSVYSEVFGIPVALFGAFYYLFVFSATLFFIFGHAEKFLKGALTATPIGFLASLWFIFLQLFIINAICFYCMVSAFCSITMFLAAAFLFFRHKKMLREHR